MERLESLRQSRLGNGETDCILCGEVFRFYHHSQKRCAECAKMTCGKCGRECALTSGHPMPGSAAAGSGSSGSHHHQSSSNQRQSSLTSSSSMSSSMTSLISSALFGGSSGISGLHGNANAGSGDYHAGDGASTVWLCKICAEQREMWKKSGAWFFKVSFLSSWHSGKYCQFLAHYKIRILYKFWAQKNYFF